MKRFALLLLISLISFGARPTTRFEYIDVFIDPGNKSLAAYQFELKTDSNTAQIVGVEGGEHAAFKSAPYYDPTALSKNRIIVAAFNTSSDLPKTKTRVARLHMRLTGDAKYQLQLESSAGADGSDLGAAVTFEKGRTP